MEKYITINGWRFKLVNQGDWTFYECRGAILYDDDHDQMPEPKLWEAAEKLEYMLIGQGLKAEANHSEKGWVEVTINN